MIRTKPWRPYHWLLLAALALTAAVYWPGLQGGFLFDDYPNIVDNHGVQPRHADLATLVNAALSSPSSEFKRPLASLSFALNYLATGLDPYWMKLTNLVFHLLNGLLIFFLSKALMRCIAGDPSLAKMSNVAETRVGFTAALISAGWMLLPINLTGVLYVVQRMESMANVFVLLGLLGYVEGRRHMLAEYSGNDKPTRNGRVFRGFALCVTSIVFGSVVGILAKETAAMLPLYAFLIEWLLFDFRQHRNLGRKSIDRVIGRTTTMANARDRRIVGLFVALLAIPMVIGLFWLAPGLLKPSTWASRDFTLGTRLLSEARVVSDYVVWTLFPTPGSLSFYHDNFVVSTDLLKPWTTPVGMFFIAALVVLVWWLRRRQQIVSLGIALFLCCQLLTGTILPLELIYEHRNYFASFGLLLAVIPLLTARSSSAGDDAMKMELVGAHVISDGLPMPLARYVLLAGLLVCWTVLTTLTAHAWGNTLRLAQDLALRAPDSPRALYELGRTYIIFSHYDPASPFTHLAYAPLEKSAELPDSSILPEQALIFMNSRMHLPLKEAWWLSMIGKLKNHKPGVQDESSLSALTDCMHRGDCKLPDSRMTEAYLAALSHPNPSPRLLAMYGDFAWNDLDDHDLGERMLRVAVAKDPAESAYLITWIRMLSVLGKKAQARTALTQLQRLNIGGRLDDNLAELRKLPALQ